LSLDRQGVQLRAAWHDSGSLAQLVSSAGMIRQLMMKIR
jgi:hypothetical protein